MSGERTPQELQQALDEVTAREHSAMAALNQAAELVAFAPSLSRLETREPILVQIVSKARSVMAFHSVGIFLFSEQDQDLLLALCDDEDQSERLQREADWLIEQGAVAWALGRNTPRFMRSLTCERCELLVHCITTPSRVRGIFLGVMADARKALSDIQLPLLSIVLQQGAQMLESFELYNLHRQANHKLAENVRLLHGARRELALAHEKLEETVHERTADLATAIVKLQAEARERERVEEQLRRRETTLRALFNATDNLIIMVDRQGAVLTCNDAATVAFGLEEAGMRGRSPRDLMPGDQAGAALEALQKAVRYEQPVYHMHEMNGRQYSVKLYPVRLPEESGSEVVVAMFGQDVTERLRAEQALRESESRYRCMFEDSPISLWEEDCSELAREFARLRRQGVEDFRSHFEADPEEVARFVKLVRVVDVNKATLEMYGVEDKAQLLTHLDHVFHEKSFESFREILLTLAQGGLSYQGESVNETLDGRLLDVQVQLSVAPGYEESLEKVIVSLMDVTGQKAMERALIQAKEAAESANRAKGVFLANMSHELRTPINGAMGLTQILQGTALSSEQREFVEGIHENTRRMLDLVNDLLDLSILDSGRFKLRERPFSLGRSLQGICNVFRGFCRQKGLDFLLDVSPQLPDRLVGDAERFKQVLANLISNAVQFTQEGSVQVRIEAAPQEAAAGGGPGAPGSGESQEATLLLRCGVTDTGIGIGTEHVQQIFETFELGEEYLTKRYSGAGMGLSIARGIVEQMGGSIAVQSEEGSGSTFTVLLPFRLQAGRNKEYGAGDLLGDACMTS